MSKELEALEWLETKCYVESPQDEKFEECVKIIKQFLQRLEAIDNASPSEALECLKKVNDYLSNVYDYKEIKEEIQKDINTIKQALIKAQEQENILNIIEKKNVNINLIKRYDNVHDYNECMYWNYTYLTQEEFELLKAYF